MKTKKRKTKYIYSVFSDGGASFLCSGTEKKCDRYLRELQEDTDDGEFDEFYVGLDIPLTIEEFIYENNLVPSMSKLGTKNFHETTRLLEAAGWTIKTAILKVTASTLCSYYTGTTPDGEDFDNVEVCWGYA